VRAWREKPPWPRHCERLGSGGDPWCIVTIVPFFFLMGANGKKKRAVSPEPLHICYFVQLFFFGERIPSTFSFSVSSLEK
jgi:hypothetical protein